jgi:MFS family permease
MSDNTVSDNSSSTLAPFKSRIFLSIWLATLISNFGMQIHTMAAAWLMASMEPSPLMVALIQVAASVPFLLFALLAGTLSDMYDKRLQMLAAQSLALVSSAVLAYFALTDSITAWGLLALIFSISVGMAFYAPVWQSSLNLQVPKEHMAEAVGLNAAGFNLARSFSPAIGGVLLTSVGAAWAFLINTVSYIGIIVVIARWKLPASAKRSNREPVLRAMGLGFRYVRLTHYMRVVIIRVLLAGTCVAVFWSLMPIIARDQLQGGAATYSIILFAFGIGSVMGGLGNRWLRLRFGTQRTALGSQLIMSLAALGCGVSHWLWLTCLLLTLAGASWMAFMTIMNTSIQLSAPKWIVGRAIAIYQTSAFGSLALGSLLWGKAATEIGINYALLLAGGLCLLSCIYSRRHPLAELDTVNADTVDIDSRFSEEIQLEPGRSKICLSLIYQVELDKEVEFLATMTELKRVRFRSGAVDWSLSQGLDNPRCWTERFISQNWDDLQMSRQRYTAQDNNVRLHACTFDQRGRPDMIREVIRSSKRSP